MEPSTPIPAYNGYKTAGKNASNNPTKKEPKIAPLHPPVELPNTPAAPPEKKQICAAGMMTTGKLKLAIKRIASNPAAYEDKNPTNTAVGANGKIVGTSNAGLELGINFSEIDTKAAVISARNILTPVIKMDIPAANVNACTKGYTNQ